MSSMRIAGLGVAAIATVLGSLAATEVEARAQDYGDYATTAPRKRTFESPQHFAFELRIGRYTPDIDSEPGIKGHPYRDVFGTLPRAMIGMEFDWQALRIPYVGTLGPGVGVGYTSMGDKAYITGTNQKSGEDTSLDIYPMWGVAVLRADVLLKEMRIPFVPYAKGGIGYALWRASNSAGTSSQPNGTGSVDGKGHSWGTMIAGGMALSLNPLDMRAAKQLDNATGVNNTLLYLEWQVLALNGLGQSNALHVGTSNWVVGLAFEF